MPGVHVSGSTWWAKPGDHLAWSRPRCGRAGCGAWSSRWTRCPACREVLGRCSDHGHAEPVLELRERHCAEAA